MPKDAALCKGRHEVHLFSGYLETFIATLQSFIGAVIDVLNMSIKKYRIYIEARIT